MNRFKWPLMAALLAVILAAGAVYAQVLPKNPVDWLIAKRITNSGTSTLAGIVTTGSDVTVGGDLAVTGDLTSGAVNVIGEVLTIGGLLNMTPAAVITVTEAMTTFAATGAIQPIAAAGAVGIDDLGTPATGSLMILVNIGAQTITISETASIVSAGNVVVGAGDTAVYAYVGAKWYQIGPLGNN
jgi:hypothetical protein